MERQVSYITGFMSEMTIRETLEEIQDEFPAVVRTCDRDEIYEVFLGDNQRLPVNTLLRLDGLKQIPFVHVKVLMLDDETAAKTEKGEDYVNEYKKLVNQEILIPLNIPYKVNSVLRPGSKPRYAVVEQVLQDRPRYLRVNTNTMSSAFSKQEPKLIAAGTELEFTRVISQGYENTDYIECRDTKNGEIYKLLQDERINFTAIQDKRVYTLQEVSDRGPLPLTIKFTGIISPHDVALYDDDLATQALLITYGCLEIIHTRTMSCLVGCLHTLDGEEDNKSTAKVVVIPEETFDLERVHIKKFHDDMQKLHFCQNKFKQYDSMEFVYRNLYMLHPEAMGCVVLRSPEIVSTEDVKDYLKPVPVVPPKVPPKPRGKSVGAQNSSLEDIQLPQRTVQQETWKKILEKTRLGFGRVHKELLTKVQQSVTVIHKSLKKQYSAPEDERRTSNFLRQSGDHPRITRSMSESCACSTPNRNINKGRPLPAIPNPSPSNLSKPSDPPVTTSDGYLIMSQLDIQYGRIKRETITKSLLEKIQQKNQSSEDFKLYTVREVYACFDMCGLQEAADICLQHRLDGEYLTNDTFDITSLREPPFSLTDFKIRKLEMIINGWRPNIEDSI